MQTISELDQNHPHVLRHGEEHFTKILSLGFRRTLELDLIELR